MSDGFLTEHIDGMSPAVVALLKKVAEESAKRTMQDCLLMLGIDITDPIKAQADFAALRRLVAASDSPESAADHIWVRKARQRSEGIAGKVWGVLISIGVASVLFWIGQGIKVAITQLPTLPPAPPH